MKIEEDSVLYYTRLDYYIILYYTILDMTTTTDDTSWMGNNINIMGRWWYSGQKFGHANLGSRVRYPDTRWPLIIIWYYCRVAEDYPNCCHTVLRRDLQCLYAFEAVAAIASHCFQHIQERT